VVHSSLRGSVFVFKLVFDNFINLFGRKSRPRKLSVPVLPAAFFLVVFYRTIAFGLTMSDEGGLEELLEFFFNRATSSSSSSSTLYSNACTCAVN